MITIHTDGSCLGNPGPGGWAAIIEQDGKKRILSGHEEGTTNNRMEILAAIRGLEAVPLHSNITIFSDSQYLVNTMTKNWKRKVNQDLWADLDTATKDRTVVWKWVRGHSGDPGNEEANALAYKQINNVTPKNGNPPASNTERTDIQSAQSSRIYVGSSWNSTSKTGAWGIVLALPSEPETTASDILESNDSSRIEITGAITGVNLIGSSERVEIHTNSRYLFHCGSEAHARTANTDLWEELEKALSGKEVTWIKGSGVQINVANDLAAALLDDINGTEQINQSPEHSKETLTHLDEEGQARMVDVGWKEPTVRVAVAKGEVRMRPGTLDLVRAGQMKKGDVLGIARIAGVMGAKRTSELIPLCHPIPLDQITVDMDLNDETNSVEITAVARTTAKTGVEMEALTAVSIAALTIYDMCKSIDREVRIDAVRLVQKSGGRSGEINLE